MSETIEKLWPLSENFEYAAEVGLALRMLRPAWWDHFQQENERTALPQSEGINFIRWVEENDDLKDRLIWVNAALANCGSKVLLETEAELLSREVTGVEYSSPLPDLTAEQEIVLYDPEPCRGYPSGQTDWLDRWTEAALSGATIIEGESEPIEKEILYRVHHPDYINGIFQAAAEGGVVLTPETVVTESAPKAIMAAAGALTQASLDAYADKKSLRLCQVRPGSHHAGKSSASGTCLVNNLAVTAALALGEDRGPVAILDVDAHHGNGTEEIFKDEPQVLTVSLQQAPPFFPSTSYSVERGYGSESNLSINVEANDSWRDNLERALIAIRRFHPRLILVELSADAHKADPVSALEAEDDDFYFLGQELRQMNVATVFELGASLSQRAWSGALRSLILGWQKGAEKTNTDDNKFNEQESSFIDIAAIDSPFGR